MEKNLKFNFERKNFNGNSDYQSTNETILPRERSFSKFKANDLEAAKSSLILLFERVDLRIITTDPTQLNMMASMRHYAVGKLQELKF